MVDFDIIFLEETFVEDIFMDFFILDFSGEWSLGDFEVAVLGGVLSFCNNLFLEDYSFLEDLVIYEIVFEIGVLVFFYDGFFDELY